ncbi:hypothetical protein BGW38_001475, partial [Lunasporangiospora selenospora]
MTSLEVSSCRAFHPIDGSDHITSLLFDIPPLNEEEPMPMVEKETFFHICLDISGSMAGSGLTCAKAAMKQLIDHLIKVCEVSPSRIWVYLFNTHSAARQLGQSDDERWLANIQSNGGKCTSFDPVMKDVASRIQTQYNNVKSNSAIGEVGDMDVTVFFLTDGQGPCGESTKSVVAKTFGENSGLCSTVHTFGFTRDHETRILSWLTSLGSETGCFQYIESSAEIEKSMSVTLDLLGDSVMAVPRKIEIWTGSDDNLIEEAEHWKQVKLANDRTSGPIQETPIRWLSRDDNECIVSINTFIQTELLKMAESINSIVCNSGLNQEEKRSELSKMDTKTEGYLETIGTITSTSVRIKEKVSREKCTTACQATRSIMNRFLTLKADAHKMGVISNSTLAEFNNLAYGQINMSKMKAKLDARAGKNVKMFEELDEKVTKVIEAIDFDLLEQNASEFEKRELCCALSTNTYIETLQDGDCLCMTMDVSRGPSAIADPSQLVIKSIFPTYWSSSMFTMALGHSLETTMPENVHGGFDRDVDARIAPGLANENITGVLPLYINEEHWKVARLRMKPIMGYVVTLDATGYTYSQQTTVPFLVLVKALGTHPMTEFQIQSKSLRENTKKQLELWCESHTNRTADVITNNYVFLGQVISAVRTGDITKEELLQWLPKLERFMVEEQIRRDMSWRVNEQLMGEILNWCSLNYSRDVEGPCRRFKDQYDAYMVKSSGSIDESVGNHYRSLYLRELREQRGIDQVEEKVEDTITVKALSITEELIEMPVLLVPEFDIVGWELTESSKERLGQIQHSIAPGADKVLRLLTFMGAIGAGMEVKQALEERLGTKEPHQLADEYFAKYSAKINLATLLQAYAHTKNSDRRSVVNMMTPFEREASTGQDRAEDEALKYIKSLCHAKMSMCFNRAVNEVEERHAELRMNAGARVFCETDDLMIAAGVLIEAKFRGSTGGSLSTKCARTRMVQPKGKIQMLIRGVHDGVRLFFDKYDDDDSIVWHPIKQTLYRMFTNHHDALNYSE